ncbi:dUTP diphosphatase [Halobacillus sp. ACCC02827]|uniref:dUTP diphosphatase n=1 Tax=Bacillaceae TaxID=186817 RepID=UPI0004006CE5|nr:MULTISPECIES: dUTP diphosphatase [Bacillaceae]QHT47371.1 dUTPase [Bacillus sp. SB49]WJE14594.1 dUTP diphosphatase [Halobacillus sp. ACCC02827]
MEWNRLYDMQRALDQYIEDQHDIKQGTKTEEKILALLVEIGELANETRCFKFWSSKGPSEKEVILEEYVDGIHFLLSLGLDSGFHFEPGAYVCRETETEAFLNVYKAVEAFREQKDKQSYHALFLGYLQLAATIGLTEEEWFHAYLSKNEVNYQRQDEGY